MRNGLPLSRPLETTFMHAILIDSQQRLVWSEVPDPSPKENELLIEVHAAALNRADLMQRAGNYPPPPGCKDNYMGWP